MIAKFNNIRPENFQRLNAFVTSDLNFVQVVRRPEGEKPADEDEDFDSKKDRVRVAKIMNFGKDDKAVHTAIFVDIMMKDWVVDYVEMPGGKGWKRVRLPIPRQVTDMIFDCLGVFPDSAELVQKEVDDNSIAGEVARRFSDIQDKFDQEMEETEPM